jgi:integrase
MSRRRWGSGELVPPARPGGPWAFRWRENGRRRYKGGFPTRDLAQRALDRLRGRLAEQRAGLPPELRTLPTLGALAEEWLDRRQHTHRDWRHDRGRWTGHLAPAFAKLKPPEVDSGRIRSFVEDRLRAGLDPATVQLCVRELSTLFSDLAERPAETGVQVNPVRGLPRATRRLFKPRHDPRLVPYVETLAQVRSLFRTMPRVEGVAYAIGVLAGLRTAEILAVEWERIDLDARRLIVRWQVQHGEFAPLKDDEARIVPISSALLPVLAAYRLETGGRGLLFPPAHPGRRSGPTRKPARFMRPHRLADALKAAAREVGLPAICDWEKPWYQATRHTYASQYVLAGGSLEQLSVLLGHSSTEVTKRYAHLRPDALARADVDRIAVDLTGGPAPVLSLKDGQPLASATRHGEGRIAGKHKRA